MVDLFLIYMAGAIFGAAVKIVWDRRAERRKVTHLLEIVLFELEKTSRRVTDSLDQLPEPVRRQLEAGGDAELSQEMVVQKAPFHFPKPYTVDAWKTLIATGYVAELPRPLVVRLFALYDRIAGFNYMGQIAVEFFKLVSHDNNLDPETNRRLAAACRTETWGPLWEVQEEIDELIELIKAEIG